MLNESHNAETSGRFPRTPAGPRFASFARTKSWWLRARCAAHSDLAWPVKEGIPTLRRNTVLGWIRFRRAVAPIIHG